MQCFTNIATHQQPAQVEASQAQHATPQLIMITDAGQDLDDEVRLARSSCLGRFSLPLLFFSQMTMVLMRSLHDNGLVNCKGAVANLAPSRARARLVRGTFNELGLGEVPVATGTDGGFTKYTASFEETARDYIAPDDERFDDTHGIDLLKQLYESADDNSLSLLCMCASIVCHAHTRALLYT